LRMLAFILRARGELTLARQAYTESFDLGERTRAVGLALVAMSEGKHEEAVEILEPALNSVPPSQPIVARQLLPFTVEALVAVGRLEDAARYVDTTPQLPEEGMGEAQLHHAIGLLRLGQHRFAEAVGELTQASESWEKIGNRLEHRRARVALLEAMLSASNGSDALTLGRQLLDELGRPLLPREREVVRRMLRRAGVRTPPTKTASTGELPVLKSILTSREEAVLHEVAKGRTNREIATELGISEKTVSVHVSHILAKLGCKTRTQAASYSLAREGAR